MKPRIIQICGTEDYLWQDNVKMRDAFQAANWPENRFESHPGCHSWEFWDTYIKTVLTLFFGK